jgi:hypothetical protein
MKKNDVIVERSINLKDLQSFPLIMAIGLFITVDLEYH